MKVVMVLAIAALATAVARAQTPAGPGDITLLEAEALLLRKNRDIALARRAIDQVRADTLIAGQAPNPQLSWLTQNINRGRGVGAGGLQDKTVDTIVALSQTIERGGKAGLRVAAARSLETAAGAELGDTVRTRVLALRSAYYDLLALQEKTDSATETARLFERSVAAAAMRERAGDRAGADVARLRVEAARARNDAGTAAAELSRARLALAALVAIDEKAAALRAVSPWPELAEPQSPLEDQVSGRPDVRAAVARMQAADRLRDLARSLRTRDVTVSAQFEHYPATDANPGGSGNSIGIGVSVPLFLRHAYEGEAARAQADWYAARDALERTMAAARTEIARSRGDVAAASERRSRIEGELLPQARRGAEAAEFAFRNGASGVMDLLDARRTLKAIQIEASVTRADHAKALAALRAAVEPLPMEFENESLKEESMERTP